MPKVGLMTGSFGPDGSASGLPTVLVAEDEALIRMDLVEMLGELGYPVVGEAGDGQQAVDLVRVLRPGLVFLDVAMPVRDGLSAAEEIGEDGLAPVVMVTAFAQREAVERAAAAGVMGYLVKPFSRSDLVPVIEVALSRWAQLITLQDEVGALQGRIAARQTVDRAKALVQERFEVTEAEAFAMLRRWAMDARVTLSESAANFLSQAEASEPSADE